MPTRDEYLSDYEPLYAALGNVGSSIDAPSFYHRPNFGQDESVDPMAEVARASAAAEAQQLANPMQVAAPQPQAPQPPQMRQVRRPVDLMADARQQSADIGNRHRLGALIDAFITGGKNRQAITEQGRQQQADALRSGAQRQKREDLQVAQAKQRAQTEFKQAQAAEQKRAAGDPNSPQNRRYQDSLLKMFPQLKGKEDVVRTWTVEGHKRHKEMLSPLRKGAETSAAEEAKEAASAKFGKSRLDRAVELAKAKQEALLPGQLKRARAGATTINTGQIAKEERAERRKIEAEERQAARQSKAGVQKDAKEYGGLLVKSGLAGIDSNLRSLETAIADATSGGKDLFSAPDLALFKLGQVDAIRDPKTKKVARLYQQLLNRQIKEQAGSAVSGQEFERVKAASGIGLFAGGQDLMDAVTQMRAVTDEAFVDAAAPYSQESLDLYRSRRSAARQAKAGGRVRGKGAPSSRAKTSSDRVRVRHPNGKTGWIPAANLEKALAKGYEQIDG